MMQKSSQVLRVSSANQRNKSVRGFFPEQKK